MRLNATAAVAKASTHGDIRVLGRSPCAARVTLRVVLLGVGRWAPERPGADALRPSLRAARPR